MLAGCPGQDCCSGLPRRVGPGGSESISVSLLGSAARSAPRSLKAVSCSFTPPFIQGRVNADSVPGFVREASVLALASQGFAFKLSLSLIISQALFFPWKLKRLISLGSGLHQTQRMGSRWGGWEGFQFCSFPIRSQ